MDLSCYFSIFVRLRICFLLLFREREKERSINVRETSITASCTCLTILVCALTRSQTCHPSVYGMMRQSTEPTLARVGLGFVNMLPHCLESFYGYGFGFYFRAIGGCSILIPEISSLVQILEDWSMYNYDPTTMKKDLVFYCNIAWLAYVYFRMGVCLVPQQFSK